MSVKKCLKSILYLFCMTTTGSLFISAIVGTICGNGVLHYSELFKIPFLGLITSVPYVVFIAKKELSQKQMLFRNVLHFSVLAVGTFTTLVWFGWLTWQNSLFTVALFLLLYAVISIIVYRKERKTAKDINQKIKEKRNSQGE